MHVRGLLTAFERPFTCLWVVTLHIEQAFVHGASKVNDQGEERDGVRDIGAAEDGQIASYRNS